MKEGSKFSFAKAILAVLWKEKEATREMMKKHRYIKRLCAHKSDITFRSSLMRLMDCAFIKKDGYGLYSLQEKSVDRAIMAFIEAESALNSFRSERWDGGWRIIIFDVPETKRSYRNKLRDVIRKAGFKQIQSSIWAYPFPVPPYLKDILTDEHIKPYIRFITANNIENDEDLRGLFKI